MQRGIPGTRRGEVKKDARKARPENSRPWRFPAVLYRKAESEHGHNCGAHAEGEGVRELKEFCLYVQKKI